ncbi:MAG: hypothetical protein M1820_007098 [Bogoriella megaspora]|nr:MAG: hypothetical protein M1820_007098 [Bogoriella megaspora]
MPSDSTESTSEEHSEPLAADRLSSGEQEVSEYRFLLKRGRTSSPPLLKPRCFVYDSENVKLEVRAKEDIEAEGKRSYQKIELRPRQTHVALFVDKDAQTETPGKVFKTDEETKGDSHRILFAELNLRGAGFLNKILFTIGALSTLYVFSAAADS